MSAKSPPPLPIKAVRTQWEYKVMEENPSASAALENKLNILGRNGWEVVSVFSAPSASYKIQVLLKRRSSR